MVLGCRFAGGPAGIDPVVFEAAAEYCDVVSFNQYPWVNLDTGEIACLAAFDRAHETARKPFLVTEWSFAALDSGLPCTHGAGQRFRTQKERAAAAEMFLNAILSRPYFAGHSFFRWVDEPALGVNRYFPENTNYGLVNERGEPYAELVATFARIQGGGVASFDPGVKLAVLWYRPGDATQHPDVRCKAGPAFSLAPGETWSPPIPMAARIRLLPAGAP